MLLGEVDDAESAFADLGEDSVAADTVARLNTIHGQDLASREAQIEEGREAEAAPAEEEADVPFYRKVIAHARGEDPGGYGPNWSNVDDFDIPTVLRKNMD